jgi:hypothetical protein
MKKDETVIYYPVCKNGYIKHIQTAHTLGLISKKQLIKNLQKDNKIIIVKNYSNKVCGQLCGSFLELV